MPNDFAQRVPFGLNDLPIEPPDDPNTLFSPDGFASIGARRTSEGPVIPARYVRRTYPGPAGGIFPNQLGANPSVTKIPAPSIPDSWKILGEMMFGTQWLPIILENRARGKSRSRDDYCHERFTEEEAECRRNNVDPAHKDFLRGCIARAEDRRGKCISNKGRPHPDEPAKWRAGSDANPGDEEVWRNPDR
jgi:hypothetical protein